MRLPSPGVSISSSLFKKTDGTVRTAHETEERDTHDGGYAGCQNIRRGLRPNKTVINRTVGSA
jgi:hypothetical protein